MKLFTVALVCLALLGCARSGHSQEPPLLTPYDKPMSAEWEQLDRTAKSAMTAVLKKYRDVQCAYLLKRFDEGGVSHFTLSIVFDGEANSEAINAAISAFAGVAPPEKELEVLLLTPDLQRKVIAQAKAEPFYVRD
ncbi:enhanced serine sensitivity protein SseB C-terminal domain-containing protein [Arenimonas oryziterrae]|nr:enhanced serine sensitivity protein SseB C-terminal domain-containing protein [Arenimonas oryziterrae]